MFHVIPQNTSNISSSMNETLSKMDVDLNINLDYGEVEVRISQFMVLMCKFDYVLFIDLMLDINTIGF